MYLPPLQPVNNSDIRICGDVQIHPTASIAPGVILYAAPNSSIVIEAEVCIGMGAILNAYQGSIQVESGAILGSGVLVIGNSRIGRNTCIGSATTIFNASVPAMVVINPGSLIGDTSRQIQEIEVAETDLLKQSTTNTQQDSSTATKTSNIEENDDLWAETALESQISTSNTTGVEEEQVEQQLAVSESENNGFEEIKIHPDTNGSENKSNSSSVVGQVYINQLLLTLFPQGKSQGKDNQKNSE